MIFELFWSEKIDADLDLWVRGPNDSAVGYAQPSGQVFNLLRDDRGLTADHTPLNYEISFTRGILKVNIRQMCIYLNMIKAKLLLKQL